MLTADLSKHSWRIVHLVRRVFSTSGKLNAITHYTRRYDTCCEETHVQRCSFPNPPAVLDYLFPPSGGKKNDLTPDAQCAIVIFITKARVLHLLGFQRSHRPSLKEAFWWIRLLLSLGDSAHDRATVSLCQFRDTRLTSSIQSSRGAELKDTTIYLSSCPTRMYVLWRRILKDSQYSVAAPLASLKNAKVAKLSTWLPTTLRRA